MAITRSITRGITRPITRGITSGQADAADLSFGFGLGGSVPAGLLTFTRASGRTIGGADGFLATLGNNVYQTEYDINGNPLGLVVEAASTNVITASEAFDGGGAPWVNNNVVITANNAVAPDGATTAELVQNNASNAGHLIYLGSPGLTPTTSFTYSKFFKRDDHDWVALRIDDSGGATYAHFNLNTGAVGTADAGVTARIEAYANGWHRCSASKAANGAITFINTYLVSADNGKNAAYVGTGTGVWMWGAMLEEGAFASSYIATAGSAQTRAAERATFPFTVTSALSGRIAGRTANGGSTTTQTLLDLDDTGFNNLIQFGRNASGNIYMNVGTAGSTIASITLGAMADNTDFVIKFSVSANDFRASLDGGLATPDTAGAFPTGITIANLGTDPTGGFPWYGHVRDIELFRSIKSNNYLTAP